MQPTLNINFTVVDGLFVEETNVYIEAVPTFSIDTHVLYLQAAIREDTFRTDVEDLEKRCQVMLCSHLFCRADSVPVICIHVLFI